MALTETSQIAKIWRARHQPEEDPGGQRGASGVGGFPGGLVQSGQERGLGIFRGGAAELEQRGQRWELRGFRYQPQQVPVDCVDQLQEPEGFHPAHSDPRGVRQGEMER